MYLPTLRPYVLTSKSVGNRVGVAAQVVLVEALGVAVAEQPGDLLLQHGPHRLSQGRALGHWTGGRRKRNTHLLSGAKP